MDVTVFALGPEVLRSHLVLKQKLVFLTGILTATPVIRKHFDVYNIYGQFPSCVWMFDSRFMGKRGFTFILTLSMNQHPVKRKETRL